MRSIEEDRSGQRGVGKEVEREVKVEVEKKLYAVVFCFFYHISYICLVFHILYFTFFSVLHTCACIHKIFYYASFIL